MWYLSQIDCGFAANGVKLSSVFHETSAIPAFRSAAILPPMPQTSKSDTGSPPLRKRGPGRERTKTTPPQYPNELEGLRQGRGLSQSAVARLAGMSASYYGEIERGDVRLNSDTAAKLQRVFPGFTFADSAKDIATTPVRIIIAAQENDGRPDSYGLPVELVEVPTPRALRDIGDCVAAEIADDSADRDFAQGTVLYLLPVVEDTSLQVGARVVVRFLVGDRAAKGPVAEVLYGLIDRSPTGDLIIWTRSSNRRIPPSLIIQREPMSLRGFSERILSLIPRPPTIEYQPRDDDEAEILGVVVYAAGPV